MLGNHTAPSVDQVLAKAAEIAQRCAAHADAIDQWGAFPVQEFAWLTEAGLLAIPLRRQLGGLGFGIDAHLTDQLLRLLKRIGWGNLAVGRIYEGHINALQLIQTFGTADQVRKYARDVRERHKIFGVWNAEGADGVTITPLSHGRYRLEGSKTFCSGGSFVHRPFVNGKLPDGSWQMCIVPMDEVTTHSDPNWWQPSGMRATASYKIDFTGVELDSDTLIGQPGDYVRQPWLTGGVVRFAAVQLGGAEALFDLSRQYLQATGRTNHPYQEERLGQMAIRLESGNLWLRGAAEQLLAYAPMFGGSLTHEPTPSETDNPSVRQLVAYVNMVRSAVEQICMDMIQYTERSVGTSGLMPPYAIDRVIRDLTLYLRQPAHDAAIADVGKHVLAQPQPAQQLW